MNFEVRHSADCPASLGPMPCSCGAEDPINPPHYTSHPSGIECIRVTEHMNFNCGNAMKYLWRADEKGDPLENLKKARWYIDREIARRIARTVASQTAPHNAPLANAAAWEEHRASVNKTTALSAMTAAERADITAWKERNI